MTENEERAKLGEAALQAFSDATKRTGPPRELSLYTGASFVLIDLLADLMHMASVSGIDYPACHRIAVSHFTEERKSA